MKKKNLNFYAYKNENKPITESEIYRILLLKQTVITFNIVFLYQNISVNHRTDNFYQKLKFKKKSPNKSKVLI